MDQDNDGRIDDLAMTFTVDGHDIEVATADTQLQISNPRAVSRSELIQLLSEDLRDVVLEPAFGPNRIFIASNTLGNGSSISVKDLGTLGTVIGYDQIADNVPFGNDGDTVTIGSTTFVFIHSNDHNLELADHNNRVKVMVGSTVMETANNLTSAINAQPSLSYAADSSNGIVSISAKTPGAQGNDITLAKQDRSNADITLSSSSLTGGH
ncbi:hypothetical protein [Sporosarcina trichiuri]|uniref:hypothetical protein n=1 Tax=Sporosarcina trichiuri TaxID=3056445 RepID=UPI0025B34FE2|nr:hypothetical protein [Sporosarcina sp. 0.2-SM1T-5]WJY26449.1 hypothetical protein QWT68_10190 [Sporosarcina sp. 0.2-SM1T-5]